jgi:hypothetical protein
MIGKKLLIIFVFILLLNGIFAEVTSITISKEYARDTGTIINFSGTSDEASGVAQLTIFSGKNSTGIDFNANIVGSAFAGGFYIDIDGEPVSGTNPTIDTDSNDTVTVKDKFNDTTNDTIWVDSIEPNNVAVLTIAGDNKFEDYFSGKINVSYNPTLITDSTSSGVDKHIIYIVSAGSPESYSSSTKKFINNNDVGTKDINSLSPVIADGNYYVVVDANDLAGNVSTSLQVLATKKNVYFDNTKPSISSVKLDSTTATIASNKIYTGDTNFSLTVLLTEVSGVKASSSLTLIRPDSGSRLSNYDITNGFVINSEDIAGVWVTGDIFKISIDANDNVNNRYTSDFNIIVDLNAPPVPVTTAVIEDVDKNVTITWTAVTDTGGSQLKEYKVYRSSSSFTTTLPSTLICTTTLLTCMDTTEKDSDESYFYGAVAIDNAGNISSANTDSVTTGPECTVTINDDNDFTNLATVNLDLTFSEDVNEMSFSCNGTTFSTYVAEDDIATFNITSGNGCSTTNEEKTVYFRVKTDDEDDPRTTICTDEIYYDTTDPDVPTGLTAQTLINGAIKLTWTESDDENTDSLINYRIYYADTNVTTSSSYKEVEDSSTYTYQPNADVNLYFKISAIDEAGNESNLSSAVLGIAKKIGADFTITIGQSNDLNNVVYVGAGSQTITFESDESLTGNPVVSVKQASDAYTTITSTYDNTTRKGTASFNFTKSGVGIIKITATNTSSESSITEYTFTIDANIPDYNFGHTNPNPATYHFYLSNLPTDIYRVRYILDSKTEICFKELVTDYNCTYDANTTADGNHIIVIQLYDKALNVKEKSFSFVLNLVDEDQVTCDELKIVVATKLGKVLEDLDLFTAVGIDKDLDKTIPEKLTIVTAKKTTGDGNYSANNFAIAKDEYTFAKNELILIEELLPKISIFKTTTTTTIFDENTVVPETMILDANIITKTKALYTEKSISVDRNFEIIKIGVQNFFSITLSVKNTSATEKTITIIEEIPKSFAGNISQLSFNNKIDVLVKDPIIKYTMKIPASSSKEITYRLLKPVTEVDMVTKYNTIKFASPLIIDGNITSAQLNIKRPVNTNILIYLISIIIVFIIIVVIIGAISNYKQKLNVTVKPDSKKLMYDYLGITDSNKTAAENNTTTQNTKDQKSQSETKKSDSGEKFQEDYDYILSAIKKR